MHKKALHPIKTDVCLHVYCFLSRDTKLVLSSSFISILADTFESRIVIKNTCPILLFKTDSVTEDIHVGASTCNSCKYRKMLVNISENAARARDFS